MWMVSIWRSNLEMLKAELTSPWNTLVAHVYSKLDLITRECRQRCRHYRHSDTEPKRCISEHGAEP